MDGELLNYNNKRKMDKLFTKEAVNTALKVCVFGSLGLGDPKELAKEVDSLPEDLGKMVISSIMAGHITLLKSRASKEAGDNLKQEVLKAIKESQKNENSKN